MNILVIGASRGTGALAVKEALARGHSVTAFSRSPEKLGLDHPKLTLKPGDFHDAASVDGAVVGHDAVIVTASATSLKGFKENPTYFSAGTALTIAGMKAHGVRRLIVLSALGAGETRERSSWFLRFFVIDGILKLPFADHDRQEKMVKESGLDWVIARPGRLTDGPAKHAYQKVTGPEEVPSSIARADVAHFLVDAAEHPTWDGHAVQLGG